MQIRLKEQTGQMYVSGRIDLVTPCDLVKFFRKTKSVTKSRLHCTVHCTYLELLFELTFGSSVGHQNLMLWRRRPDQSTTNQPHKVLTRTTIKAE